jgi:LPS-assembly lipoprotein
VITQTYRLIVLLLCVGLLSACGFHLRGSSQIAERFNPINLQRDQLSDQQWRQLRSALINASATLTEAEDAPRLRVSINRLKDSKLTSSSSANVQLIQLGMQLRFSVLDAQSNLLIEPQELIQNRTVELDSDNVLSQQDSINTAQIELEKDLIRSMIYRLQK